MTQNEQTRDAINDILSGPYLKPMGSKFEQRVSQFKDSILIGHNRIIQEQNQQMEDIIIENHKLRAENQDLQRRLEVWKNHLHALNLDELLKFQQSSYKENIKSKENKILNDIIKPEPMIDLIRNLKQELNFERDRNLELEQLVRKLEKEVAISKNDREFIEQQQLREPLFHTNTKNFMKTDQPTRGYQPSQKFEGIDPYIYKFDKDYDFQKFKHSQQDYQQFPPYFESTIPLRDYQAQQSCYQDTVQRPMTNQIQPYYSPTHNYQYYFM